MNTRLANALDFVLAHVRNGVRVAAPPTRIRVEVYRNSRGKLIANGPDLPAACFGPDISALMARVTGQLEQTYGSGPFVIEVDVKPSANK